MPARKSGSEEPLDLDDLLGTDEDVAAAVVSEHPEMVPSETTEQRRIRELQAELARPNEKKVVRPTPESQLTPDQRKIRELEDQLARRRTQEAEDAETEWETASGEGERILLHVVEDGLIAMGVVWYRGQEIEFIVGSEAYEQTKDRNGVSWLDMLDDIDAQFDRWGQQFIKRGPWRGKKWGDTSVLSDPEEIAAAKTAAEAERRRNRAAPVIR